MCRPAEVLEATHRFPCALQSPGRQPSVRDVLVVTPRRTCCVCTSAPNTEGRRRRTTGLFVSRGRSRSNAPVTYIILPMPSSYVVIFTVFCPATSCGPFPPSLSRFPADVICVLTRSPPKRPDHHRRVRSKRAEAPHTAHQTKQMTRAGRYSGSTCSR